MNPLFVEALGAIVRAGLQWLAGFLVAAGIWSQASADQYVSALAGAIVMALLSVGWSLWQKYKMRLKLVTALSTSAAMTERQVEASVKAGEAPSVTTQKTEVPQ